MKKVSDLIANKLVEHGIRQVFMITGGGAMHLNDSLGKHPSLNCMFHHHEQACAIAAEGYYRVTGKIAVVNVTTGPGGLNTLTGVMGQWTDSIPVLYISGQVKFETTIHSHPDIRLRQLGDQEVDIINVVKPLTKYAHMVTDPLEIGKVIDEALYHALSGRQGPVWIDVPMNVQGAVIDEVLLQKYYPNTNLSVPESNKVDRIGEVIELLRNSVRPVIIAGQGIRLSGAISEFYSLIDYIKIPVLGTFNNYDILPSDYPFNAGRIGTVGTRSGNYALQNSDLIISIGSRNNIRQVSYNWENYGRASKKVIVDIDPAELNKRTVRPDIAVWADAKYFILNMLGKLKDVSLPDWSAWLSWCLERRKKYQVVLPEYEKSPNVNPYFFMKVLTECMKEGDIAVAGNGSACVTAFQAGVVKKNQRIFWNSGCASMGYDLPAAIGACVGSGGKSTVCIAGDGSLQMNIQELQTVVHNKLPVKIFVLSNDGYVSIKQTQMNFFGLPYVGCNDQSGVSFPDISKIGPAYGIKTFVIDKHENMIDTISQILDDTGPVMCDVRLETEYIFSPKLSSERKPDGRIISKPLEDMYPFLEREEFFNNMIIPPMEE